MHVIRVKIVLFYEAEEESHRGPGTSFSELLIFIYLFILSDTNNEMNRHTHEAALLFNGTFQSYMLQMEEPPHAPQQPPREIAHFNVQDLYI